MENNLFLMFTPQNKHALNVVNNNIFKGQNEKIKYAVVYEHVWVENVTVNRFGMEIPTNKTKTNRNKCFDFFESKKEALERLHAIPKITNKTYKNAFLVKRK